VHRQTELQATTALDGEALERQLRMACVASMQR
jgi:hypothetical protein